MSDYPFCPWPECKLLIKSGHSTCCIDHPDSAPPPPSPVTTDCPACGRGKVTHWGGRCSIRPDGRVCCSHLSEAAKAKLPNRPALAPPSPTLAGDAAARKALPLFDGLLGYFPNACAEVARVSAAGNAQHNPGQPMHWAFNKSVGTGNEIVRHLTARGTLDTDGLRHTAKAAWRALELLERELLEACPELQPGVNVRNLTRASAKQKVAK